jgi:hypothetical protein
VLGAARVVVTGAVDAGVGCVGVTGDVVVGDADELAGLGEGREEDSALGEINTGTLNDGPPDGVAVSGELFC